MEEFLSENSRLFVINYFGLDLKFELFNIEYIWNKLEKLQQEMEFSVTKLKIERPKPFSELKKLCRDNSGEKYHFFAYIKFFEFKNQKYGLVGGKTTYTYPDISFDYKKDEADKRIARNFLQDKYEDEELKWSNEIIVVNHAPFLGDGMDKQQAIFLERFLQRQFNLFDS